MMKLPGNPKDRLNQLFINTITLTVFSLAVSCYLEFLMREVIRFH